MKEENFEFTRIAKKSRKITEKKNHKKAKNNKKDAEGNLI